MASGQQPADIAQEQYGQIEILGGQPERLIVPQQLTRLIVNPESIHFEVLLCGLDRVAPGHSLQACQQFQSAQRFNEVVIGARTQCGDDVFLCVACSADENRDTGAQLLPYPSQHVDSADVGHIPVQQQSVEGLISCSSA
jgi:hypothetical protein